jgi:hypothetical protein
MFQFPSLIINRRGEYASMHRSLAPLRIGVFREVRHASWFKAHHHGRRFVVPKTAGQETRSHKGAVDLRASGSISIRLN